MATALASHADSIVIDLVAGRLSVHGSPVDLRPKTWEVLRHLVERPGQLVRKDELLDSVWSDVVVSESTLSKSIGELRAALDDSSQAPRCIETVSRRGFRWVGRARLVDNSTARSSAASPAARAEPKVEEKPAADAGASLVIARDRELARLEAALARAESGRRQLVVVTGEAGAGKTTLVDRFLESLEQRDEVPLLAHGQCIETSGQQEPYLPVFEALDRLARQRDAAETVTSVLRRCAPSWVLQMPSLAASMDGTQSPVPGRMLRELTTALTDLARRRTLVLVLEDLHWSDLATTDACNAIARQRDEANLLLVVTMRNAEALVRDHPVITVTRELLARELGEEIALPSFAREAMRDYLALRCPGLEARRELVDRLFVQTAGNPLFVRLVVDGWIGRGLLAPSADGSWALRGDAEEMGLTVPDNLRALLERQLAKLTAAEKTVLEVASVRSGDFDACSIAAVTGGDIEETEDLCRRIATHGQLLRPGGRVTRADGKATEQYSFLHASVQQVVVEDLPASRRRRLHLATAEQLERENEGRSSAVAAQLAHHFEAANEIARALPYMRESARAALRRDSPRDAIATLEHALALCDEARRSGGSAAAASGGDIDLERLLTMSALSHAHQLADGLHAKRVEELWSRTRELAAQREDVHGALIADAGSLMVACVSARYAAADQLMNDAMTLLDRAPDDARQAFYFSAATVRWRVAALADAARLFESALALEHASNPVPGADFIAVMLSQYAPVLALQGRAEEAQRLARQSVERARSHSHYSECVTSAIAAFALAMMKDYDGAEPWAARAFEIAEADGYRTWATRPLCLLGISDIRRGSIDEGIEKVRRGIEGRAGDGQLVDHSALLGMFAEALLDAAGSDASLLDQAEARIAEATGFIASSGELYNECEILRLRARAMQLRGDAAAAKQELRRAVDLAQSRAMLLHEGWLQRDLTALGA